MHGRSNHGTRTGWLLDRRCVRQSVRDKWLYILHSMIQTISIVEDLFARQTLRSSLTPPTRAGVTYPAIAAFALVFLDMQMFIYGEPGSTMSNCATPTRIVEASTASPMVPLEVQSSAFFGSSRLWWSLCLFDCHIINGRGYLLLLLSKEGQKGSHLNTTPMWGINDRVKYYCGIRLEC